MSRPVGNWVVPRMWEGGECWILGGGSSLPRQFGVPDEVIQKVMTNELPKSTYSSYFKEIHNKHVIGVNVAFQLGDWISMMYFGDLPFYRNYMLQLHEFHNLKVTDTGNLPQQPELIQNHKNIKKLKRDMRSGISEYQDTLRWNHHSGGGAINLAALTGVKRILLLGFDMKPSGDVTHWHAGGPGYYKPTVQKSFDRFLMSFPKIAEDAKRLHIEILNVSMESAITVFPKVQLKEIL